MFIKCQNVKARIQNCLHWEIDNETIIMTSKSRKHFRKHFWQVSLTISFVRLIARTGYYGRKFISKYHYYPMFNISRKHTDNVKRHMFLLQCPNGYWIFMMISLKYCSFVLLFLCIITFLYHFFLVVYYYF